MKTDTIKCETLLVDRIIRAPVKEHVQLLANHFRRYDLAASKMAICSTDCIIDASCGNGYGSYILSLRAKKVFGLDINNDYLNAARRVFKNRNLYFYNYRIFDKLSNLKKVPKADKIVCIETFEHISKDDIGYFLMRLLSYLRDNGDMFLTAPLGDNKPCAYNKFHLNKPSIDYLNGIFRPLFRKIDFETNKFIDSFGHNSIYCYVTMSNFKKGILDRKNTGALYDRLK